MRRAPFLLFAVLLALPVPFAAAQEVPWPTAAHDGSRTGTAAGPSPPYSVAWTAEAPAGGPMAEPVVAEDRIIVLGRTGVAALGADDGSVLWEESRAPGRAGTPAIAGDLVVFAAGTGEETSLVARSLEDGGRAWSIELGAPAFGPPAIADDLLVVGTHDGRLLALDAGSGEERWVFEADGGFDAAPAIGEGVVLAVARRTAVGRSTLLAFDADGGPDVEPRWRFSPPGTAFLSAPAIGDGFAVVGSTEPLVRALGINDGEERWSTPARDAFQSRSIPIAPDDVYAADRTHVTRLDADAGEELWTFQVADLGGLPGGRFNTLETSDVAVIGDAVVVGDAAGELSAIDAGSGHRMWRRDVGEGPLSAPSAGPDALYVSVLGEEGAVVALEEDPSGTLIDEVSPTVLFPGRALLNYAAAAAAVGAAIFLLFGLLLRPREETA